LKNNLIQMAKKLIIFDLDNTLFKSKESYKYILAEIISEKLGVEEEISVRSFEETEKEMGDTKEYPTIKDFYREFNSRLFDKIFRPIGREEIIELEDMLKQMNQLIPVRLKTYPLVKETIKELKDKGYKIAILTGTWEKKVGSFNDLEYAKKKREVLEKLLINSGLKNMIDKLFITYEHATIKPRPEAFKIVLDYFEMKPEEAIMVGDREADILASKIGISTILFDPKEKYSGETIPDYKIKDFSELPKIIESYN